MRQISLNARHAHDDVSSDEVEVVLFHFEHPSLDEPLRLSTDATERLSTDPLIYGTRSRWLDADPATQPYNFVLVEAAVPGDMEDAAGAAQLILAAIDVGIAEILRSTTDRAIVHVAVVLASSPDVVEQEWRNMRLLSSDGGGDTHTLDISRLPIEVETVPTDTFSKGRFPGLHR